MKFLSEYVYQEQIPDDEGAKESYRREQDTLARIERYKHDAMLKGMIILDKQNSHKYIDLSEQFFKAKDLPKHEGIPTIKMKDLVPLAKREI